MNVLLLHDAPPPALAGALAEFEAGFVYPLGPGRSFRISHGDDYPRFFRAMGRAACFVAEQDGRVLGMLGVALRPLATPGGHLRGAYVGDVKVAPDARGSRVFLRLAGAALAWARPHADAAWGVVMDGTRATPTTYTGRLGIPGFLRSGKVLVLRFPAGGEPAGDDDDRWLADGERGPACFLALSRGRYAPEGGDPAKRSQSPPLWLAHPDGSACGRLEDTRRAKRLFEIAPAGGGDVEMLAAHLSCFAWNSPAAAAELIDRARRHAAACGLSGLFVSVAEGDMERLDASLGGVEKVVAPATVYAAALTAGPDWVINTSEI